MRINLKYKLFVVLWILIGLLGSGCCPEPKVRPTDIETIELAHISQFLHVEIQNGDTTFIAISDYGIRVYQHYPKFSAENQIFRPTALYAVEPCEGDNAYHSDKIIRINIRSTRDFDESHPAGTSLNDIFDAGLWSNLMSYDSLVHELNESFYEVPQPTFFLKDSTASQGMHRFILEYELESNRIVSDTTSLVYLIDREHPYAYMFY